MFYQVNFPRGKTAKFRTWDDKVIDATPSLDKFLGRETCSIIAYLDSIGAIWRVYAEKTLDSKQALY